ncbi:WbuC family cupin fold metalloprotein [Trichloromonas sp.]|uniref:WbuC family cupin fold metalloprotein n=1 Tax=Trichloromonas sp. TaxID=3069249 RepID=UPI003D8178B7
MQPSVQVIDDNLLTSLSLAAKESPRLRKNHNLHASYDEPCQRLLNAVEPGSYIRPHRHLDPAKPESFLLLRGSLAALIFADDGQIERIVPLSVGSGCQGIDIPAGFWHSLVSLAPGTVFFETKPGPYQALSDKDFAPWAPAEGSLEAGAYLQFLESALRQR